MRERRKRKRQGQKEIEKNNNNTDTNNMRKGRLNKKELRVQKRPKEDM